ncbi:MAG: protein phosphatase 2C domain-containing protein [Spirochaetales bacterium]|nr:protein phosphatase 2C domain-containing protein [Spirochaetales bacterium]
MLIALDARCQGSEHIKIARPCQDFARAMTNYWGTNAYALVADGHGGEKYFRSAEGSRIAVSSAAEEMNKVLKELLFHIKKKEANVIDKSLKNLCSRILLLWREKVKAHFSENPLSEKELKLCEELKINIPLKEEDLFMLYGSTLLSSVYFENYEFWFSLQIGDGKTYILKEDGSAISPKELENEKAAFGVTPSLCGKNAIEEFRYGFSFEKIAGICVMSDGLTDSFNLEKLPNFLISIKNNAIQNAEKTKAELEEYLPKLSEKGSGDDISIAGIFVKEDGNKLMNILRK